MVQRRRAAHAREDVARSDGAISLRSSVLEVLVWSVVCWGIWLLSLSSFDTEDALVAVACSLAAGVIATGGRWAIRGSWPPIAIPVRALARVPLAVLLDTIAVLTAPLRGRHGTFSRLRLEAAAGNAARDASYRVQITMLLSASPGSYVLDIDERDGTVLMHVIESAAPQPGEVLAAR